MIAISPCNMEIPITQNGSRHKHAWGFGRNLMAGWCVFLSQSSSGILPTEPWRPAHPKFRWILAIFGRLCQSFNASRVASKQIES